MVKLIRRRDAQVNREIDWEIFENLCQIQCTHSEIASVLSMSRPGLYERVKEEYGEDFPEVYQRFAEAGRVSLRRTQFRLAEKSASMAIFLGKVYLGQRETENALDATHKHYQQVCENLMKQINAMQTSSLEEPKVLNNEQNDPHENY